MSRFNLYLGTAAGAWTLALLTVASELWEPLRNLLASAAGHHWVAKGFLVTLVFLAAGLLLAGRKEVAARAVEDVGWYSALGSLAAVFLFYLALFLG